MAKSKKYDDFMLELKELLNKHGLSIHVGYDGCLICNKNRVDDDWLDDSFADDIEPD